MDGAQKAAETLRRLRRAIGLTQRDLARVAGVPQPTIAAIESARREPSLSLLSRITESAGFTLQLDVTPLARFSAISTSRRIENLQRQPQENEQRDDSTLREIISFRDALRQTDDEGLRASVDEPPSPSGTAKWDAFLAAVVEEECARRNVPSPRWVNDPARFVKPFWYLSTNPSLHDWEFLTAPSAYVRHGVLVAAQELASV